MKRPNLASRHHYILASCCSLVSAGAAADNAETRQAPAQMMRITNGITLCFTIALLLPRTEIACVSFAESRGSRRLADQAQPFAFRIIRGGVWPHHVQSLMKNHLSFLWPDGTSLALNRGAMQVFKRESTLSDGRKLFVYFKICS
jgi:hypothetical protein